jgi:hypothetical protein
MWRSIFSSKRLWDELRTDCVTKIRISSMHAFTMHSALTGLKRVLGRELPPRYRSLERAFGPESVLQSGEFIGEDR